MDAKRLILIGFLICFCAMPAVAANGDGQTLVVIPARYTVVQFAFDVAGLRPVYLVAYDTEGEAGTLVLYVWDSRARKWLRTSLDEYRSGAIFREQPTRVILIGRDQELPAGLAEASARSAAVVRIPSMKVVDMVNGLNRVFSFRANEWRYLAKRYQLDLEDRNAERRRYGRYGPPGGRKTEPEMPASEPEEVIMPVPLDVSSAVPVLPEEPELNEMPVEEKGMPAEPPPEHGMREEKGAPAPEPVVLEEKGMPEPEDIAPQDK